MTTTLSGVLVLFVVTTLWKVIIEAAGVDQNAPWHDPLIWLFLFSAAIGGSIVLMRLDHTLTGPQFKDAAGQGLLNAVTTLGTYHFTTHDFFQQVQANRASKKVAKTAATQDTAAPVAEANPSVSTLTPQDSGSLHANNVNQGN